MHSIRNIWRFKVVLCQRSFPLILRECSVQQTPKYAKIIISIKFMPKREIIFVYLPNTSHFMHFQSVRQKKGNIHNKTNKYRWHFLSKPHQTYVVNWRTHCLLQCWNSQIYNFYFFSPPIQFWKIKKPVQIKTVKFLSSKHWHYITIF